jgi:hypothetical protein
MNEIDYLLVKLIEEAAEVQQRAAKALQYGLGEIQEGQEFSNAHRLSEELRDMNYITCRLVQEGLVAPLGGDRVAQDARKVKFEKWKGLARSLGRLEP